MLNKLLTKLDERISDMIRRKEIEFDSLKYLMLSASEFEVFIALMKEEEEENVDSEEEDVDTGKKKST